MNCISIDCSMPVVVNIKNEPVRVNNVYCTEPVAPTDPLEVGLHRIFKGVNTVKDQNLIQFGNGSTTKVHYYSDCADRIGNMKVYEKVTSSSTCRLYLFAVIHVDNPETVIISIDGRCRGKFWIDNALIFNSQVASYRSYSVIYDLPQGDSNLIMEVDPFDPYSIISPRIMQLDKEALSLRGEIIRDYVEYTSLKKFTLLFDNTDLRENKDFLFVILPHDFVHISLDTLFTVSIYDQHMKLLSQKEFKPLVNSNINFEEWNQNSVVYLEVTCVNNDAQYVGPVIEIVLNDMNRICDDLYEQYKVRMNFLTELQKVNIEARIESIREGENVQQYLQEVNYILKDWTQENVVKQFNNRTRRIYFHSSLDGNLEHVQLTLPKQTCDKYPVLLFLNTKRYDYTPDNFNLVCNRHKAAIAQISLKGVTTGGYIGEPAVFETLELIKSIIPVDNERIYLAGISNGGYATWIMAENHPHLFAGIAPMFCSPFVPHLCNLYNTDILNLAGDKDLLIHEGGYKTTEYFKQIQKENYQFYVMEETDHNADYEIRYSNLLYDKLFAMRKKTDPTKVLFKTNRYRYAKTNYISSIDFMEEKGGEISLDIADNIVNIDTIHINSFQLDLPETIINQTNSIIVNQKRFEAMNDRKENYIFYISSTGDVTVENQVTHRNTLNGIGLLDVYLGPMEVVIPESYSDEDAKVIINRIAKQFSHPSTNGVETKLYIKYPIIKSPVTKPKNGCNRIFIGTTVCQNSGLNDILKRSQVKLLDTGFEYQGEMYSCNYSIMIAIPREDASKGTDLIIYSNNIKQMKGNIFLRSLVLPSFINGIHPFLNAQVLIYSDRGFERIYSFGSPLQKRLANGEWVE